jgi:AraC family transcriptional regulator
MQISDLHTHYNFDANNLLTDLLQEKVQQIPNAIQYNIKRYKQPVTWQYANEAQLIYHYSTLAENNNNLTLRFCVMMQDYCNEKKKSCDFCKNNTYANCNELTPTVDLVELQFTKNHLKQFFTPQQYGSLLENIIQFKHQETFSTSITFNNAILKTLQNILNHTYTGSFENIYFNAQTQLLLLQCFNSFNGTSANEMLFQCKFLATETEREKIIKAREILLQQIGEPLTIKELSRKVAINECYLKKGFRELYGQTIFDFYQSQRMEHAKYLLYSKGLSVTDVSDKLGYSSISHFSTAFKKLTGIKPCELLLH